VYWVRLVPEKFLLFCKPRSISTWLFFESARSVMKQKVTGPKLQRPYDNRRGGREKGCSTVVLRCSYMFYGLLATVVHLSGERGKFKVWGCRFNSPRGGPWPNHLKGCFSRKAVVVFEVFRESNIEARGERCFRTPCPNCRAEPSKVPAAAPRPRGRCKVTVCVLRTAY